MKIFAQNTKLKLCQTALVSLLLVLSPLALAQESDLPAGIASKKLDPQDYAPGQLIVKLKEGKTTADLQELNSKYKVSSVEKVFKDSVKPEDVLSGLKADLDKLNAEHQSWYWQLDKESKEYKDYQQKIGNEKEEIQAKIKRQEELIGRLAKRQARATGGQKGSSNLENIYLLKTQGGDNDMSGMVEDYKESPAVEYAEPNYIARANASPNDTKYSQQWAHQNTKAESGWDITTGGSDVIIAIIDSGVDYNHEDLKDNIWKDADGNPGKDFVDIATNDYTALGFELISSEDYTGVDYDPGDYLGHGTHVAGIVAAKGNNSLGVAGVCYDCKLMPVRAGFVMEYQGVALNGLENDDIANAITYAADNAADVINMSFGGKYSETAKEAIDYAYSKGVILVAAAGNKETEDKTYSYPAALDNVIAVAATVKDDTLASYSNYGDWVDVCAPGGDGDNGIISTVPTTALWGDSSGYDDSWQGTSMASPYVAGLAGLVIAKYPSYSQSDIKAKITSGADSIDSLNSGYSGKLGSGRVNIYNSLYSAEDTSDVSDEEPFFEMESVSISEKDGDGDGIVEYNEEAEVVIKIKNTLGDASSVKGTLSIEDSSVSITDSSSEYGDISKDQAKDNSSDSLKFKITSSFSGEKVVKFTLTLSASDSFSQTLYPEVVAGIKKVNATAGKNTVDEARPGISGDKVVWAQKENDYYDLKLYDLKTNQESKISTAETDSSSQRYPAISGNKVVFFDSKGTAADTDKDKWPIYLYDMDTGKETLIAAETGGSRTYLSISGNKIIWLEYWGEESGKIYLYDIDTAAEKVITAEGARPGKPVISGTKIVWQDNRNYSSDSFYDIFLYDLDTEKEEKVSPNGINAPSAPSIYENKIAYLDYRNGHSDIYLYDLDSKEEKRITPDTAKPWYCAISGSKVVYLDEREDNSNVYSYDLDGAEEKALTSDTSLDEGLAISGSKIAWIREDETDTFNVYISDIAGNTSVSAPSAPTVSDAGEYTVKTDQLYAEWKVSSDSGSDVSEYKYAIGTSQGATDVVDWTSVSTSASITKTGLSLTDGVTYYFSVKAANSAGSWSDAGYSDGITVDSNAPSTAISGAGEGDWRNASVTVTLTATDLGSGVDKTYYSTDGSDPANEYGSAITLSSDGTYTIKYYSTDKAGNSEEVKTADYQVKIDQTAPSGSITINNGDSYTSFASVSLDFSVSDAASGMGEGAKMMFSNDNSSWSSQEDYSESRAWKMPLGSGTKTIYVKFKDAAGNWSSVYSDTIILDQTSPAKPKVKDGKEHTRSHDKLSASWSSSDKESGIVEYQYSIGTAKGKTNVLDWTSAGTDTSVTVTGLKLKTGKTYYFNVKAQNGAGLLSKVGHSNGIKIKKKK